MRPCRFLQPGCSLPTSGPRPTHLQPEYSSATCTPLASCNPLPRFSRLFGINDQDDNQIYTLITLYSQSGNLAFTPYFENPTAVGNGDQYNYSLGSFAPVLAMADFNNDGTMDLVAYKYNSNTAQSSLVLFYGQSYSPGFFEEQAFPLPSYTYNTSPVAGDFNRDTKPDIAVVQENASGPATITSALNESFGGGLWSNCAYPLVGNHLSLCSPTTSAGPGSPLSFNATSNSFGQIRKIELWVDGAKITEQHNTWGHNAFFDFTSNFSAGPHVGTLYEADIDDTLQRLDFNFNVGPSTCPVSTTDPVNLCSPSATTTSPLNVQFTANPAVLGPIERMEVWVDGVKKYTNNTGVSTVSTYIPVTPGTHMIAVYGIGVTESYENGIYTTTH